MQKDSTGTLDNWILLSEHAFLQKQSMHCNEKCADQPRVSVLRCPMTVEQICATTTTTLGHNNSDDRALS